VGQPADFRVIRYAWESDSFTASFLTYEESVAKRRVARETADAFRAQEESVASRMATIRAKSAEPSRDEPPPVEMKPGLGPTMKKRLAEKGFTILDISEASAINARLREQSVEKRGKSDPQKRPWEGDREVVHRVFHERHDIESRGQSQLP